MKNKTKGVIAGLAGLALLSGGATFALWTDSANIAGGIITNGNLDVAAVGSAWYDVSADRTDRTGTNPVTTTSAHAITSLTDWRMVPGDKVEGNLGFAVALSGDNLVATLNVAVPASTGVPATMDLKYSVYQNGNTTPIVSGVALGTPSNVRLMAPRTDQGAGNPSQTGAIVVTKTSLGATPTADFTVVVTATFADTTALTDVNAVTTLNAVAVTLTQTRTAGSGNGF